MQVLISVQTPAEAALALTAEPDVVDVKNVGEGSLGAAFPWVLRDVVGAARRQGARTSAALGDLPARPGTAALAAAGAAATGVDDVKAGLHGTRNHEQAAALLRAVVRSARGVNAGVRVVAAGYADWPAIGSVGPCDLVRAAGDTGCDLVMLDTAVKDGRTLFDHMAIDALRAFVAAGHRAGLGVALAGSIRHAHMPLLLDLGPDLVGVRGAVCVDATDRATRINAERARAFCALARRPQVRTPNEERGPR